MHSDECLRVYTASLGTAGVTAGSPVFTSDPFAVREGHECLVDLAYKLPSETGVTFSWALQTSPNLVSWLNISETVTVTPIVAGSAVFTNVYGYLEDLPSFIGSNGFLRIQGTATGLSSETLTVTAHANVARSGYTVFNLSAFRDAFGFDVRAG